MHDKIRASFRWLLVWLLVISIENVLTNLDNTVETPPVRAILLRILYCFEKSFSACFRSCLFLVE